MKNPVVPDPRYHKHKLLLNAFRLIIIIIIIILVSPHVGEMMLGIEFLKDHNDGISVREKLCGRNSS